MSAEWTLEPKLCFFCTELDEGYALQDKKGEWQASCWECCKKRLKSLQSQKIEEDPANGF